MKDHYISMTGKRVVIATFVELIVAIITILLIVTDTAPTFLRGTWMLFAYYMIILFLAFVSSMLFLATCSILIVGVCVNHYLNRSEQQAEKKVKSTLSHEFKPVKLKNKEILQNVLDDSTISCQARLDENNEIVFQIQINANASGHTDDYSHFLEKFSID